MNRPRIHAVTMPKWGMTMGGGAVVSWLVAEGASVEPGTEVAEVETTKTAGPVESGRAGVLRRQVARIGAALPVGGLIGVISDPDVPDSEIAEFIAGHAVPSEPGAVDAYPASRSVATGSGRFNVLDAGEGAPAFLLIHGFGGSLESWSLLQNELAGERRVIAFDLPGHGDSSVALADWSLEAMSRAVIELMDAMELPSAHLVAHSLGGAIAILAAAGAPGRALSLTLLDSAGLGPEIDGAYVRDFVAATRRKDLAPVVAKLFADPRLASKSMVEQILRMKRIDGAEEALAGIARAVFSDGRQARTDLASVLTTTGVPAQAIWGADDRIIPAAHASRVATHVLLPATGHMPQIEKPVEVARIVRDFAAKHEAPR
jgi:pyruvate dehydrogenase E2 component (dihydrolipoamide acetyltransferase)